MKPLFIIPFFLLCLFLFLDLPSIRSLALPTDRSDVVHVQHQKPASKGDHSTPHPSKTVEMPTLNSPAVTLKLAFMAEPSLFSYELECHIQENTIELMGAVTIEEEKALAANLTSHLMRGKEIVNHIEVQPALRATLQHTEDMRITELIRQRFATSQTLRDANFEILTIRGMVSLKGQTRYQVIALEAAQAARDIPGVIAVDTRHIRLEREND